MSDHDPVERPDPLAAPPTTASADAAARERRRLATDEAFSDFYRGTIKPLVGFLVNNGASVAAAADIAQETMIKLYRSWHEIDHPKAWVHTVASRAWARKVADVREQPLEAVPEPTSLLPGPDAVAEWEVRHETLRVLRLLPPRQRQVLAWSLNDFTPAEIADELGITAEAVRSNLKKARRAAAQHLRDREER